MRETSNNSDQGRTAGALPFAWMGWGLGLASGWRPLRITGTWSAGKVVFGDGECAVLQVKWWRPKRTRFDASRWLTQRLSKAAGPPASDGPSPAGFEPVAWIPADAAAGTLRSLWYGYCSAASLVLEAVVNADTPRATRRMVEQCILPSLRPERCDGPVRVAVFGASFQAPSGFELRSWRLMLGDIALLLCRDADGSRLVLRQVYPAALALARRALSRWLESSPFPEHRQLVQVQPAEELSVETDTEPATGLCRLGHKRFPFPFGRISALINLSAAVHDERADRIYLAACDARNTVERQLVVASLRAMQPVAEQAEPAT